MNGLQKGEKNNNRFGLRGCFDEQPRFERAKKEVF